MIHLTICVDSIRSVFLTNNDRLLRYISYTLEMCVHKCKLVIKVKNIINNGTVPIRTKQQYIILNLPFLHLQHLVCVFLTKM